MLRQTLPVILVIFFTLHSPLCARSEGIRSYQHHSLQIPSDKKEDIRIDIDHYYNAGNLWEVLRTQFNLPHEETNVRVQKKMKWYFQHPDHLVRAMKRASPWLYFISVQAKKRRLPAELVLLPVIESAYNPFARNATSGAAGIWQIMPNTATGYGLRQNWWYDGRLDIIASTTTALDHLAYLHRVFSGDWLLALAAYDAGEGTVLAAIHKNKEAGKATDFWSLALPKETQDYVPRLLALAAIVRHPEFYPTNLPTIPNAPYLAEVKTASQIDLSLAASLAHLSLSKLRDLNPGFNQPATGPGEPSRLVVPIENVAQFADNLHALSDQPRLHWIRYRIKSGESLEDVAAQFNTSPGALIRKNPKLSEYPVSGKEILVAVSDPAPATVKKAKNHALQPGDTLYMVRRGDTLEKIARHFHVSTKQLMAFNQQSREAFHMGNSIIVPTHTTKQTKEVNPGDTLYTVRNDETISDIAEKFHTTTAAIRLINLLADSYVRPGDRLIIPTVG